MKVQSAIQARIHASLKQEYKILAEIIRDYTDPKYPYETDEGESIKVEDFDDRIDVVPVSDPNASSMAQRIMQYQAALQLAAQAPNLYDMPLLHRQMMDLIGIPNADKVVPDTDEVPPKDPVSENQDILTMSPVKAYEYQDHDAHMRVHMVLKSDPQMAQEVQNSPAGGAVMGALDAHVREHLAFIFRRQIEEELGVPLPPTDQPLPEDVEKRLSSLVAEAADQLTGKKQQQAQAQQQAEQQQDPIIQQRERELGIRESEVQRKQQADQAKQQIEQQKQQIEQQKLAADQQQDAAELELEREKLALDETELMIKTQIDREQFEELQEVEGYKHDVSQKERAVDREDKRAKELLGQQERESDREVDGYKSAVELEQREKDRKSKGE
jgi:hypothetical protein